MPTSSMLGFGRSYAGGMNPGLAYGGQNLLGMSSATIGSVLGGAAAGVIRNFAGGSDRTQGGTFDVGEDIEITDRYGNSYRKPKRRRRRRLLTAQDKSDIAFLVGQLGTGQAGKAALSSLLARRC